jgi:putative protease
MEERIGHVTHFYNRIGVAAVEVEHGALHKGDRIHIVGHSTDEEQIVDSMELDHHQIDEAVEGQDVGIKLLEEERVHEKDIVYKTYM